MAPPPPPPPNPPAMPAFSAAPSGQQRDMLLQSIRQGTKLKKTVTVDKSGPFIAGKISSSSGSSNNIESSRGDVGSSNGPVKQMSVNGGPPGLGNLFAGGMPKLKPTGLGIGSTMTSHREGSSPRSLTMDTKSRGPPPQPPPAIHKPQISSSASDSVLTSPHGSGNVSGHRPNNGPLVLPSKPPVGGYGKPNVAPKPPVPKEPPSPQSSFLHQTSGSLDQSSGSDQSKPSPPPKKISLNGRPGVNRAQSMRVPGSPPVAPPTSPPFPPAKHNLVKNQSTLHQSQDGINGRNFPASKTGTLPHSFQKPTLYPPNNPPPPAPSQRTPTRPPVTRPPTRPAPPPAPPPPPPHRTLPAPPPPSLQARTTSAASSSSPVPPPPPVRNLSVRNGSIHFQTEIESRFAHLFHHTNEFPDPGAFRNLVKTYNTRASVIAKQPAPPPPVPPTTVQLGNKMWVNNTSHC